MRRAISIRSWSLKAAGAERSELSIEIATSALLRAGRLLLPEKITSSIVDARIDLYDDSPITQRSASTRLDLPQPFGPTTPVNPGSIRKSVGSTNDLNPISRSRVSFILKASHLLRDHAPNPKRHALVVTPDFTVNKYSARSGAWPDRYAGAGQAGTMNR